MGNGSLNRSEEPQRPSSAPAVLLGATAGLGPFTVDSYLPALPILGVELGAGEAHVQLTLAATMIGFAVGQLLVGPWSDRVGRRIPLVAGLALLVAASIGAVLAGDIVQLLAARLLQGAGASAAAVTALATARDGNQGDRLVRVIGIIALIQSIAPLVAPIVGGVVIGLAGWRGVFVALSAYALVILCLLPPRLQRRARRAGRPPSALARYRRLSRDPQLVALLLLSGLRFIGLFTFLQWSPFLFQNDLDVPPAVFGVLFAVMTLGMMAGLQLSPLAIRRGVRPRRVLWASFIVMSAGSAVLAVSGQIAGVVAACVIFLLGCGLGLPTIQTLALAQHGEDAGTVAGLIGAVGFGLAGLIAPLLTLLPQSGLEYRVALAGVIAVVAVLSSLVVAIVQRTRHRLP